MEFNDQKTVRKILDTSNIRLHGVNLSLSKASRHLASLLSSIDNKDESDDDDEVQTLRPEPILQNQSSTHQENIQQSFVNLTSSPILIPSSE